MVCSASWPVLWTLLSVIVCVFGDANVRTFSVEPTAPQNKTIRACYYSNRMLNETEIPPDICTHIIFATALITPNGVVARNASDVYSWMLLVKLKETNPNLKILISIGGDFRSVVGQGPYVLQSFVSGTKKLLLTYDLDGIDVDWETPGLLDRLAFVEFQEAVSAMLRSEGKLFSAALPHDLLVFELGYSVAAVNKYFDLMAVMTYDYHRYSPSSPHTDYNSPLKPAAKVIEELINIAGVKPSILLLGYATYGYSWRLADPANHGLYAKAIGAGPPGPYLNSTGYVALADICLEVKQGGKIVEDSINGAEYMYHGVTWASFNGMYSAKIEAEWIRKSGIGGVGFFALEFADFKNICGYGKFPVFNAVKKILEQP